MLFFLIDRVEEMGWNWLSLQPLSGSWKAQGEGVLRFFKVMWRASSIEQHQNLGTLHDLQVRVDAINSLNHCITARICF